MNAFAPQPPVAEMRRGQREAAVWREGREDSSSVGAADYAPAR